MHTKTTIEWNERFKCHLQINMRNFEASNRRKELTCAHFFEDAKICSNMRRQKSLQKWKWNPAANWVCKDTRNRLKDVSNRFVALNRWWLRSIKRLQTYFRLFGRITLELSLLNLTEATGSNNHALVAVLSAILLEFEHVGICNLTFAI